MTKMIPDLTGDQILAAHNSAAEARVYQALRDKLSNDVTVLYSVPWIVPSRNGASDGETDFVIVAVDVPQVGDDRHKNWAKVVT